MNESANSGLNPYMKPLDKGSLMSRPAPLAVHRPAPAQAAAPSEAAPAPAARRVTFFAREEAEKKAAEAKKITIDFSQLSRIRRDVAITRDKLTVEEDWEEELPEPVPEAAPQAQPAPAAPPDAGDCPLVPAEYRLMQNLLYGTDYGWVQSEGYLLSVLVDGINEKLYDTFQDSVLELEDRL